MPTFRDTDHMYRVLGAFFERVAAQKEIADAMLAGSFVLRMSYSNPDGQITIDLREPTLTWTFGPSDLEPELELIQSGDVAHQFWLGRLNITGAIATRKVVARGPVAKALKLLPALKPAYPLYAQVLAEIGEEALLPAEDEGGPSAWSRLVARVSRALSGGGRRGGGVVDLESLNQHLIPLVDDPPEQQVTYREQALPAGEPELRAAMLERMALIRAFEERLSSANAKGEVPTEAIHLSIGQEAVAVGVCFALRADDTIATTHRGHGHMLAKGADLDGMMAEMLAKATGLCGGKGGSMHVTEAAVGAIGANGIVGASPLAAAGAGHSARLRGTDQVAVAFMGDGATNQGMFHEAVNFAAVLDLPCVFVIENNLYGEFTAVADHVKVKRLSDRAAAYGIPGKTIDGNDAWAVYEATREAVAAARAGEGPTLLECLTYRWHGHMEGEAGAYRPDGELEAWKERCPVQAMGRRVEEEGTLDGQGVEQALARAGEQVAVAWDRALQAPEPTASALTTDVYAPEDRALFSPAPTPKTEREISCSQALFEALAEEMARDERVYLLGEDVSLGGYFAVTAGLADEVGPDRVIDTPISEYAIVGSAVGAAMTGCRPVAEILFSDFLTTCMDPLVNQAAKLRYMSGGQYAVPMVVRTPGGAGLGMAAQHSQSLEAWLSGIPGLIIVAPGDAYDAKGLLKASIRSNNPVLFFENKLLYATTGLVPEEEYIVPLGRAKVKRPGRDVTLVTVGAALGRALDAAAALDRQGVEVEVVDLRTLVPLDLKTVVRSVQKTGRLVTLEEGCLGHGFGSEIVARVAEAALPALRAAPRRVAGMDIPLPYNTNLEQAALPSEEAIIAAIKAVM